MRTIYNSGKFTGVLPEEEAYKKFAMYTQMLEEKGYCVIDPTLLVPKGTSYDDAMHICLNAVRYGESIFMHPDWMQSEGACKELMEAHKKGKRIYWSIEDVPALPGSPAFLSKMTPSKEELDELKKLFRNTPTLTFPFTVVQVSKDVFKVGEQPQEHKLELCDRKCCFIYRNVHIAVDHKVFIEKLDHHPSFKYCVRQALGNVLYFPSHEEALRAKAEIEALQKLAKKQIAEEAVTNSANN